jgi:hypothetical protein
MWAAWTAFLSAGRHIFHLPIDYKNWAPYERLAELTGFRYVHEKFCIVSELPGELHVDEDNQGHCETGPYVRWADGSAAYMIHGHRVPAWVVEFPERITVEKIDAESDAEVRRIMMDKYGISRYLTESGAKFLDSDTLRLEGSGLRALMVDKKGQHWLIGTDGSTSRVYHMPVPPAKTCVEAHQIISGGIESALICEA